MSTPEPPVDPSRPPGPQVYYVPAAPGGLPKGVWFLFGFLSAIGLGIIALIGTFVVVAASGGLDDFVPDYIVSGERIEKAVDQPCKDMVEAGSEITAQAPADAAADRLATFARSLDAIVKAIDSASPDTDARAWRRDLVALADAVRTFAKDVRAGGGGNLEIPRIDDRSITERMWLGSPEKCEIPINVESLDPRVVKDNYRY